MPASEQVVVRCDHTGCLQLVTFDWGYDLAEFLAHHGRMTVRIHQSSDTELGIEGALTEVISCVKGPS